MTKGGELRATGSSDSTICFVGLGTFGLPIALHCMNAGFEVVTLDTGHDRAGRKALADAGAGVLSPASPECEAMVLCLPDARAAQDVVERYRDRLPALIVDLSSHSPGAARRLHALCARAGSTYIDAPVSGSVQDAAQGGLTQFIGADRGADVLADAIMETVADKRFYFGRVGHGQGVKLVNQLVHISNVAVLGEGLRLARCLGLPASGVLEALAHASADSAMLRRFGDRLVGPDTSAAAFRTALAAKDMRNVAAEYRAAKGADLPIQSIVREALESAEAAGSARENFTRLIEFLPGTAARP